MEQAVLPRWDLDEAFPSLDSKEFASALDDAVAHIGQLADLFEKFGVRRRTISKVDDAFVADFERVMTQINGLLEKLRTLDAYVGCIVTTDASNEQAQSAESLLSAHHVRVDQLLTRFTAWVGSSDVDALLLRSQVAREHEYAVRRAQVLARHQMAEGEEDLASALRPASIEAWARLHGNMSARLVGKMELDGQAQELPMSRLRALASHPNREVRRAAFEAELLAWESVAVPFAAALNGVKGYQQVVRRRRGYEDDLEPTFVMNGVDRRILDAMHSAVAEVQVDFRRYLEAKAKILGLDRLAWYDLAAPVGREAKKWEWQEAEEFIVRNFASYSDRLADFARYAFKNRWVDAEPRVGKEGGAYCTSLKPGVSRIMMNYDGSFNSISTLAHELGHAYHNLNLATRTPLQRATPMTLAETASIFCETLAFDAALRNADASDRLVLLDIVLQRDLGVLVDVYSRFLFEGRVFAMRSERDLTVTELKDLMMQCQRDTYGDAVDPLHPYMWAVKGHYYGPLFYNYPYTFGLLFGLGLYAAYLQDADGFRRRYDELLSRTGLADAASLAREFGFDLAASAFWRSSLDVVRGEIEEFVRLANS
ncbi:MAG: M3 family oligoendopeptidase [Chthonomonadales bacterium]